MHRNNDINQVSMSSIEPAANLNTKGDLPNNKNKGIRIKNAKEVKQLNNKSSEKDDSFCDPTIEE
jgi:hypothetical protein